MKYFIVPFNTEATKILDYGGEDPSIMTIIQLSAERVDVLWKMGLFDKLNRNLNLLLSDAEDDAIVGKPLLVKAHSILEEYMQSHPENVDLKILNKLVEEAIEKNTGIYIYL